MSLEQDLNLVRKIAWNYTKSTSMDFDDLFSEGCIAYLEAEKDWNEEKGKKSTFMWTRIQNHFNDIMKKERSSNKWINFVNEEFFSWIPDMDEGHEYSYRPETHLLEKENWHEFTQHLSPEAQAICNIILNNNSLYLPINAPKRCRGIIKNAMRQAGWSWSCIWNGYKELKNALA